MNYGIKDFLITNLIRLLDPSPKIGDIDDKKIEEWLARQWQDVGYHEYFRKRDLTLLKTMGSGIDEATYRTYIGKRLELLTQLHRVQSAYTKKVEQQKYKIEKGRDKKQSKK